MIFTGTEILMKVGLKRLVLWHIITLYRGEVFIRGIFKGLVASKVTVKLTI